MLQALLEHAGLGGVFTAVLSADAVQTYKPSPSVYELAPVHLGIDLAGIGARPGPVVWPRSWS
jgi:FMN phosphatase YigB (HAD superfamily)